MKKKPKNNNKIFRLQRKSLIIEKKKQNYNYMVFQWKRKTVMKKTQKYLYNAVFIKLLKFWNASI